MKARQSNQKEKQLRAKLDSVRNMHQLKDIFNSVEQQNSALREDILALRYKVDLLLQKQKAKNSYVSKEDEAKANELRLQQTQLKEQYKIMQELKKRKEYSQAEQGTEQLNEQQLKLNNNIRTIEHQVSEARREAADLKRQCLKLQKTIELQEEEQKRNDPKIASYNSENSLLRKKILELKKIGNEKEFQSAKVMNSMYSIKIKINKNEQLQREIESKKLGLTRDRISKSKSQLIDVEKLSNEVSMMRKEVQKRQQQLTKKELLALRRKDQLLQWNKQQVGKQKQLEDKLVRTERELNKYKRIWQKYIEYKNNSKFLKEFIETPIQADQFASEKEPLRRQYAGILGGKIRFDDRIALRDNFKSFITGFIVYELENNVTSKNNLVALRAIYDDPEASSSNQVPIPGQYLSKCKSNKYLLMEGDFIKLFKVKYQSNDSRILKIEIRTNKNNRYEFGDKRLFSDLNAGQNVYAFDISIQEYPVCLFGSYNQSRSHWFMESLGVEINDLPN